MLKGNYQVWPYSTKMPTNPSESREAMKPAAKGGNSQPGKKRVIPFSEKRMCAHKALQSKLKKNQ